MVIQNKSGECADVEAGSRHASLEVELRDNKKFLQTIIDTEPECVKLLSADGILLMMNRAGLDMLQVDSLDQVKGKSLCPLIVSEHRGAFDRILEQVFQGKSGTLTFEMEGTKGRRLWLETHAVPLRNDSNEIIALLGITRDVTERQRTEDALKKERDFSAAVLNTVGSMVLVLDRSGKIVRFNRTCEDISGYSFDEVRDRHVWDFLVPKEQIEDVKKIFSDRSSKMFPSKSENEWVTKDGKRRLISWSDTALFDATGDVEYVILTGIDITDQRHAERELLQEKVFSDTIIDSLPGTFYICDSRGKLIRWNNNEKEVTGYSIEEMSQMNVLDLFREDKPLIVNKLKEVLEKGRASTEARLVTRSGMHIPFLLTGFRMTMQENQYIVGVGIDISARKKLEEQLRQSQKMECLGSLAGGIAHDFNNILTAIIGYGNLLQMKMLPDDPLRHNVVQILASANRAATLTQGLLAYSRKQVLNPQPVDLNEIIRRVDRLLIRLIGEDVELKTLLSDKEISVLADPSQIEQVLMNLATNARDAMPQGGHLFIETELVEMDEETAKAHDFQKPGIYALIAVTDSGTGMDDKMRERIFEPFFTTKESGKGTGLGLALVYSITKQHEGSIHVYSEVGRGTAFKIYLPVVPMAAEETLHSNLPPITGGTETILVAEDDETVRALTSSILEQFGYVVIQAEDGEDAVNKFMMNRDNVKMLLLDVIMPKKNGKEVYDKIRIFKPEVKSLFLSGYTAEIIQQKGLLDKGLNFILKPAPMNDLLRKVRSILDN
jgi:two-component system, cell cycle sensor histidine kinase and response regulator CckA